MALTEQHELIIDSEGTITAMHSDALMGAELLPAGALTIGRLSQVEPVVLGARATWCITNAKGDLVLKTGFTTRAAALAWEKEHLSELLAANR